MTRPESSHREDLPTPVACTTTKAAQWQAGLPSGGFAAILLAVGRDRPERICVERQGDLSAGAVSVWVMFAPIDAAPEELSSIAQVDRAGWDGAYAFEISDYLNAADMEAVCRNETLADAVTAGAERVHGVCRFWVRSIDESQMCVAFMVSHERWAVSRFTFTDSYNWGGVPNLNAEARLRRRRRLLAEVFRRAVAYDTLNARLALPFTPLSTDLRTRSVREGTRVSQIEEFNAVLGMWWDIRLAEGCAPEDARMLLGLTVPVATLQRLTFPTGAPGDTDAPDTADAAPFIGYDGSCPFSPPPADSIS